VQQMSIGGQRGGDSGGGCGWASPVCVGRQWAEQGVTTLVSLVGVGSRGA
jgi:hypothetical protein